MYSLSIDSLHLPTKAETLKQWYPKTLLENKIPNLKYQITNKSQISIFNDQNIHHSCIASLRKLWCNGDDAVELYCIQFIGLVCDELSRIEYCI
jgi:hypothetical protein